MNISTRTLINPPHLDDSETTFQTPLEAPIHMKLTQLRDAAERAVENAKECGVDPDTIPVTLQLDREGNDSIWSDSEVELHWDNNGCASGCVITAFVEEETPKKGEEVLLVSFADVPLGHRIRYPGIARIFTVVSQFRNERDDEPMSGTIAEYVRGSGTRASLYTHFGGREDCPDKVILVD